MSERSHPALMSAWGALAAVCLAWALPCAGQAEPPPLPPPASPAPDAAKPTAPEVLAEDEDDAEAESEAVVELRDGQRWSGKLIKRDDERIVLRIGGITTTLPMTDVKSVYVLAPTMDQYRELRSKLDDGDTASLLRLVDWLRERHKFATALKELDAILKREPFNPQARQMRLLVQEQKTLRDKSKVRDAAPGGKPAGGPAMPPQFPLLSPEEINLMKVYEVDLADPPRMLVDRGTIARLMDAHVGDPLIPATREGREAMFRKPAAQILELMFRLQDRDFYGDVKVLDQPKAMKIFRDDVHETWLMNSCATFRCHGGQDAGRLWLYTRSRNSDATVYTNFLILDRFRLADGRSLIDYEEPQRSPLLQLGLPREDSITKHPPVPGRGSSGDLFKPVFRTTDDRRFKEAVAWIRSMYRPRPDYPIAYRPPLPEGAANLQPAQAPKDR